MKNFVEKNSRVIITTLILSVFAAYFILNVEKFKPLLNANFALLLLVGLSNIGGIFINGLITKFILEPFEKYISITESFYLSVISTIGNFFAPAGTGFGIRAVYLKKKHSLPYSEFISTLSGNYIVVILINSGIGLVALYLLRSQYNAQFIALALAFSLMFIMALSLSLMKINTSKGIPKDKSSSLRRNLYRVIYGWSKISSDRNLMFRLIVLVLVNFMLAALMYWMIIHSIGLTISISALLLFTVLGSLAIFINITPANLGVKEAIYLFSASVLGFSVSDILLIALVDRGVQFAVLLILWIFTSRSREKYTPTG